MAFKLKFIDSHLRLIKCLLFTLLSLSFNKSLFAQENRNQERKLIYSGGDIISGDLITQEVILKGNVKILFDNYELSAKEARVSKKTFSFIASDNVVITGNDSIIEADRIEMNYKTRIGTITNARIMSGQLLLTAKKVLKLSNEVFEAQDGSFTTCNTCPPGWRIKAKKIKTNINKYVDLRGGKFQILNTTVFPLPRIVMPLNTRRKTGVLFPELATVSSRLGAEIALPYFWALTPHSDLTFSPKVYFKLNGDKNNPVRVNDPASVKAHFEYRHLLSRESRLNLRFAHMYDATYTDINGIKDPLFRYMLSYKNYFKLPHNITQKTKLTLVRDREYLFDFVNEAKGVREGSLLNSFSFNKNYDHSFLSAETIYNINLLKEDPRAENDDAIHKAPEISHSIIERPVLGNFLFLRNNLTYTNFARNTSSFDTVETSPTDYINTDIPLSERETKSIIDNTGQFDASKDLLRTGHRLRLESELSSPFNIGRAFDVLPSISYRDSLYKFNVNQNDALNLGALNSYNDTASSRYLEGRVSLRTELTKVYNKTFKHKIEPELTYRNGTPVDQTDNVFFQAQNNLPYHRRNKPISDFDFFDFRHGVQFDYWDRYFRAELVEFNLTNVLIQKKYQDKIPFYEQPLFFNIRQGYDFKNARETTGTSRDPWSNLDATLKFRFKHVQTLATASHYHEAGATDISARTTLIHRPGKFIQLRYDNTNIISELNERESRTRTVGLGLGWEFPTLQVQGSIDYNIDEGVDNNWNLNFNYTPRGRCWDIRLGVAKVQNVNDKNDIQTSLSASFNLGPDNTFRRSISGLNTSINLEKNKR